MATVLIRCDILNMLHLRPCHFEYICVNRASIKGQGGVFLRVHIDDVLNATQNSADG